MTFASVTQDFFTAGGTLNSSAPSYVERPADRQLGELVLSGQLCYVLTTRQMGKSSLMVRTAAFLQERDVKTAIIDLTAIGAAPIEEWYLSLLDDLQSHLPLVTDAEKWWLENEHLPPVKRFTKYLRTVLLEEVDGQIAVFIDEIDSVLNLDFADDFFAAIRAIYNQGAFLAAERRLSFVLLGVAAPDDLIKDQNKTPFNIGVRIDLDELALDDAGVLLQGLPDQEESVLARIFYWTAGHPYLTQKTGSAVAAANGQAIADETVDELVKGLFLNDDALIQETNLQFVQRRLLASPNRERLLAIYKKVYRGKQIESSERSIYQNELKLYGLLKADEQGTLAVRNRIYREAFDQKWIKEHTLVNWWRRFAVVIVPLIVIALVAGFFYLQRALEPDDVLAQSYITAFEETANPTLRLDNLANLLVLEGYDQEALELFNTISVDEQLMLFENLTPDLGLQVRETVQGIYETLYVQDLQQTEETTRLLQAMSAALEQSTDAQSRALRAEIGIWLQGRGYAAQDNYLPARTAYDLAISLNNQNPATYFERSLTASKLDDPDSAISDLALVWDQGPAWEQAVLDAIYGDEQIQTTLWSMDEPPPFVFFFPSPTPTETPTATATSPATATATEMLTPTLTPMPSATPTTEPPATATATVAPTETPTNTPPAPTNTPPAPTNTPVPTSPPPDPTSPPSIIPTRTPKPENPSPEPTSPPPEPGGDPLPEPTSPPPSP